MNRERLQYACDLVNRNNERTDAAQMKCKVGKPCNGRCIPQEHTCGGSEHRAITMAYHHIGGDDVVNELTQKNKKMDKEHAQMYTREVARLHLVTGNDHQAFNRDLDRINKKYASSFDR